MASSSPLVRPLIAGNWKMYGATRDLAELDALRAAIAGTAVDILVCPPATLVGQAAQLMRGGPVAIGGQDCHVETEGAHTGDVSAAMLADQGATHVILGHSERRRDHQESSQAVAAKARAAKAAGLLPIICVGETLSEREAGQASSVVAAQLTESIPADCDSGVVIAYEPVWAIGTGLTPSQDEIAAMHSEIRRRLTDRYGDAGAGVRLLYGGSVKPQNAAEIFAAAEVNGALVGGASLKAADFAAIIRAHPIAGV